MQSIDLSVWCAKAALVRAGVLTSATLREPATLPADRLAVECPGPDRAPVPAMPTLAELRIGQQATVRHFADELQGFSRRRLLDLGLTPGATVTAAMRSLLGDPVAYRVRGTLIALRREQAQQIYVEPARAGEQS